MAEGDISAVIDSLEFDETKCESTFIDSVHISGDIWALIYTGDGYDGYLCTLSIDSSGNISNTVIDSLEFETTKGAYTRITHINGTVYALIYSNNADDTNIKTINIADNGTIGAVIATKSINTYAKYNTLFPIGASTNIYGIVYYGSGADGYIDTVQINDDGSIENRLDTYEFDTSYCHFSSVVHLNDTKYAVAYNGNIDDPDEGIIKTINIADDGTITKSILDTAKYDTAYGKYPKIIHISGTIYAITYEGVSHLATLKTISIADNGTIGTIIDTYEFYNHTTTTYVDLIRFGTSNIFIIAYNSSVGQIITVKIADNGTITTPYLDILPSFETGVYGSHLIEIGNDIFAVAHRGRDSDGFVETFEVEPEAEPPPSVIAVGNWYKINGMMRRL